MSSFISSFKRFKPLGAFFAVIAVFLAAEIAMRVSAFGPDAVVRFWQYTPRPFVQSGLIDNAEGRGFGFKPGFDGYFRGKPITINQAGFRQPEGVHLEKAPGTYRIAMLGDSNGAGVGVDGEVIFSHQLELALNRALPLADHQTEIEHVEVLNFAVPAYQLPQMIATYNTAVKKFQPDAIMLPLYYGDLDAPQGPLFGGVESFTVSQFNLRTWLQDSFVYGWLRNVPRQWTSPFLQANWRGRGNAAPVTAPATNKDYLTPLVDEWVNQGLSVFFYGLRRINEGDEALQAQQREQIADWMQGEFEAKPVSYLDTVPLLNNMVSAQDAIYPGDSHVNGTVHCLYALDMANQLLTKVSGLYDSPVFNVNKAQCATAQMTVNALEWRQANKVTPD